MLATETIETNAPEAHAPMNSRVYTFEPLTDSRWDNFVQADPRTSIFHTKSWLTALHSAYKYQPLGYTFAAPGEPLNSAVVFCRVRSWLTGERLVSLPFSDHCEPLVDSVEQLHALLKPAQQELREAKIKYIDVRPLSLSYCEGLENAESYYLHVLDLRPGEEALFKKFHGDSIRRKIQRADREKLTLEVGASETLLEEFYNLHVITRQRQEMPPHPKFWFRKILASLGEDAKIRVARKDGVAIASIFTLAHKQKMVYKYGCSDHHSHNLGGMQFLFWHLIRESKERGFVELDFGRSEISNGGLITFKDRWGGNRQTITYLRHPPRQPPAGTLSSPSPLMTLGKKAFAHFPQSLLRIVGNLLYPHVG
jgi:hypothetical protein